MHSLIIKRKDSFVPIYENLLNDENDSIRAIAITGLILKGRTELSLKLIELAKLKKGATRDIVYSLMSQLMLPEFVPIIFDGQSEKSAKFKLYNFAQISDVGINRSIDVLLAASLSENQKIVEQSTSCLYEVTGKLFFPEDLNSIEQECKKITEARNPNLRYYKTQLLTPEVLINELHKSSNLFWQLLSMTGEHFGFDPNLDALHNWESIKKRRAWSKENNHEFKPGAFYFLGEKKEFSIKNKVF